MPIRFVAGISETLRFCRNARESTCLNYRRQLRPKGKYCEPAAERHPGKRGRCAVRLVGKKRTGSNLSGSGQISAYDAGTAD